MKVAVIERKLFGGTCVNTGCIPTKTMVASAYAARMAARAAEYGVDVGGRSRVDMKRVKARKDAVSAASRTGLEDWLRNMENCTVYQGHARFESAHEVSVGGERLRADQIFINVGGRALVPDMPGFDEITYLTNSSMMDVDFLPEAPDRRRRQLHRARVRADVPPLRQRGDDHRDGRRGSSAARTKTSRPRSARSSSARASRCALNAKCISFAKRGDEIVASVDCADGAPRSAAARTCCSPSAAVPIPTISASRRRASRSTSAATSWSTTSCARTSRASGRSATATARALSPTRRTTTPRSSTANLLDNDPRRVSDRITAYALYIDPPLGRAGMTEAEIRKSGRTALVGKRPMTRVGRAVEKGETQGFMKIVVDAETRRRFSAPRSSAPAATRSSTRFST